jgi:hypothetical protein
VRAQRPAIATKENRPKKTKLPVECGWLCEAANDGAKPEPVLRTADFEVK